MTTITEVNSFLFKVLKVTFEVDLIYLYTYLFISISQIKITIPFSNAPQLALPVILKSFNIKEHGYAE